MKSIHVFLGLVRLWGYISFPVANGLLRVDVQLCHSAATTTDSRPTVRCLSSLVDHDFSCSETTDRPMNSIISMSGTIMTFADDEPLTPKTGVKTGQGVCPKHNMLSQFYGAG